MDTPNPNSLLAPLRATAAHKERTNGRWDTRVFSYSYVSLFFHYEVKV